MKKIMSIVLCFILMATTVIFTYAVESTEFSDNYVEDTNNESNLPKGDSDNELVEESLIDQFVDILNNCKSEQEREIVLLKAHQMGINADEFKNVKLTKRDLTIFDATIDLADLSKNERRILTPDCNYAESSVTKAASRVTVAGVSMPTYALWPKIYKQETKTYCSAATVYTTAKYIGATPPSQAKIMSFWDSEWGVTYPDLPLIRNYMNYHLPGKQSKYVPYVNKTYAGSQTTFNKDLKNNVENRQPMILHMRNSSGTTNWPYTTSGHFCICSGLLTWENNKYFIGDPYYFSQYVSGATANNGEHKRTWSQLNKVITNRFGSGAQNYLT